VHELELAADAEELFQVEALELLRGELPPAPRLSSIGRRLPFSFRVSV
jgi:hypothetical protein